MYYTPFSPQIERGADDVEREFISHDNAAPLHLNSMLPSMLGRVWVCRMGKFKLRRLSRLLFHSHLILAAAGVRFQTTAAESELTEAASGWRGPKIPQRRMKGPRRVSLGNRNGPPS